MRRTDGRVVLDSSSAYPKIQTVSAAMRGMNGRDIGIARLRHPTAVRVREMVPEMRRRKTAVAFWRIMGASSESGRVP